MEVDIGDAKKAVLSDVPDGTVTPQKRKEKNQKWCTLLGLMVEQKEKMALDLHLTISRKGMDAEGDSVSMVR